VNLIKSWIVACPSHISESRQPMPSFLLDYPTCTVQVRSIKIYKTQSIQIFEFILPLNFLKFYFTANSQLLFTFHPQNLFLQLAHWNNAMGKYTLCKKYHPLKLLFEFTAISLLQYSFNIQNMTKYSLLLTSQ
jgi:hypothetical protein